MSIKSFLKSNLFLKQLALAIVITFSLAYLTLFMLKIYTDHGESYPVPDLSGMTVKQAEKVITTKGFRFQVIDSLYVKDAVPGTVIGQVPVAGANVKKNRTLFLTTCTMTPEQIAMPKLTDIAYQQALNVIESLGLEIGNVVYKPSEYTNLVLEQRIYGEIAEVGMQVPKGTRVDLVVGQVFSDEEIDIPNLLGETYSGAKDTLATYFLNLGAVIFDDSLSFEEDSAIARIWRQRPEPSPIHKIYQGQSIDIWLTTDEEKLQNALQDKY
ncbi:MAG: PASTA domain-containing protein [Prolixibacteraceae bacterium]|nr:PASTA domain-containing protein [Prolixibacteraceae bacterium]